MIPVVRSEGETFLTMQEGSLDPITEAKLKEAFARHARNTDWYQAHAQKLRAKYPGKYISIVDSEVFVGEDRQELDARVRSARPEGWNSAFRTYIRPHPAA